MNLLHTLRKIRACESETAALVLLENTHDAGWNAAIEWSAEVPVDFSDELIYVFDAIRKGIKE